ncbi:MAG: hypothetical protein QM765_31140 [Myxococcales bacterium]
MAPRSSATSRSPRPAISTALRAALQPLAAAKESPEVVARLLDLVAADHAAKRRSVRDTIALLGQMHAGVTLTDELREALHPFGIHAMLGAAGVEEAVSADLEARLEHLLAR